MSLLNSSDTQFHFDVIDGWGGNLGSGGVIQDSIKPAAVHLYAPSGTTPLKRGAIVMSSHDGTDPTVEIPLVDANVNLEATDKIPVKRYWMVVEGNTEYDYSSRLGSNKVVCLRGQFAIRTAHVNAALSIGDQVTVEHGADGNVVEGLLPHQSTGGSPGVNEGRLALRAAGDPLLGEVVDKETIDGVDVYTIECSL